MLKTSSQALSTILIAVSPFLVMGCQDGLESSSSQITNGEVPSSSSPIAHSAIRIDGRFSDRSEFMCSGTVLSPDVILTAAHCVTEMETSDIRRRLSPSLLKVNNSFSFFNSNYDVEKILVPEEYLKPTALRDLGYDIALIKLKSPLPKDYSPASIATDFDSAIKKDLYSAGFGSWTADSSTEDQNATSDLSFGRLLLSPNDFSEHDLIAAGVNRSDSKLLKFWSSSSDPALCKGDSGGPIYYEENGNIRVIGVNVSIQFKNAKDARQFRCANDRADELASSVFSENIHFISEAFQSLTGQALPGVGNLRPVEDDPSSLDFFLKNGDTAPHKNQWIDLSALVASIQNGKFMAYPQSIAHNRCLLEDPFATLLKGTFLAGFDVFKADAQGIASVTLKRIVPKFGQSSTLSEILSEKAPVETYFRGKIKIQADTIILAVLTPSGVVQASLPIVDCLNR